MEVLPLGPIRFTLLLPLRLSSLFVFLLFLELGIVLLLLALGMVLHLSLQFLLPLLDKILLLSSLITVLVSNLVQVNVGATHEALDRFAEYLFDARYFEQVE